MCQVYCTYPPGPTHEYRRPLSLRENGIFECKDVLNGSSAKWTRSRRTRLCPVCAAIRSEWQIRGNFLTQAIARAGPSHNDHVELLYQRRTRRARSVFQRLALPTPVSISNGICSG